MLNQYDQNFVSLSGRITAPKKIHENICVLAICQTSSLNTQYEQNHFIDCEFINRGNALIADWAIRDLRKGDEIRIDGYLVQRKLGKDENKQKNLRVAVKVFKVISTTETRQLLNKTLTERRKENENSSDNKNSTQANISSNEKPLSEALTQVPATNTTPAETPMLASKPKREVIDSIGSF